MVYQFVESRDLDGPTCPHFDGQTGDIPLSNQRHCVFRPNVFLTSRISAS